MTGGTGRRTETEVEKRAAEVARTDTEIGVEVETGTEIGTEVEVRTGATGIGTKTEIEKRLAEVARTDTGIGVEVETGAKTTIGVAITEVLMLIYKVASKNYIDRHVIVTVTCHNFLLFF